MAPIRLDLTARLCDALGLFAADDVEVHLPGVASDEVLHTVHDPEFVDATRRFGAKQWRDVPFTDAQVAELVRAGAAEFAGGLLHNRD